VLNASIVGNKGMPNLSVYSASKAAVRSFARSLANDLKPRRIRVNALSPGATITPIMEKGLKLDRSGIEAFEAMLAANAPAGRMGKPEEIADGALFLASPTSTYVNGIELSVDGGLAQV
jgi:NAD(P)-dependent dehydrogenase (short-subunit alcohol dehydrogenase family)